MCTLPSPSAFLPCPAVCHSVFAAAAGLPAAGFLAVLGVEHLPVAVDFALESVPSREHTSGVMFRVRVCLFSEATLGLVRVLLVSVFLAPLKPHAELRRPGLLRRAASGWVFEPGVWVRGHP